MDGWRWGSGKEGGRVGDEREQEVGGFKGTYSKSGIELSE